MLSSRKPRVIALSLNTVWIQNLDTDRSHVPAMDLERSFVARTKAAGANSTTPFMCVTSSQANQDVKRKNPFEIKGPGLMEAGKRRSAARSTLKVSKYKILSSMNRREIQPRSSVPKNPRLLVRTAGSTNL